MKYDEILKKQKDYVIEMRREFHANPEPSWKEFRTSKRVKEELDKMGIEYKDCAVTGVVGTIKGGKPMEEQLLLELIWMLLNCLR